MGSGAMRLCPVLDVSLQANCLILCLSFPSVKWGNPMGLLEGLNDQESVKCLAHSNGSNDRITISTTSPSPVNDCINTSTSPANDHIITARVLSPAMIVL